MNILKYKKPEKSKVWSFILTLLVIAIYLVPNFASAVDVSISNIEDTNKGNDISFDITIDINTPDRYVPINYTNLTIAYTGNSIDKLECVIQPDGSYTCYRTKGNYTTEFTNINITTTKEANLGYGYGYGYGYDTGEDYRYNFGYGYGYGYPENFGKITYHILWHTPVNLNSGNYYARAKLIAKDKIFSSLEEQFVILTPTDTSPSTPSGGGGGSSGSFSCDSEENINSRRCTEIVCPKYLEVNDCSDKRFEDHLCCVYYNTPKIQMKVIDLEALKTKPAEQETIEQQIVEEEVVEEIETTPEKKKSKAWIIIPILGILVVGGLVYHFKKKRET